MSAKAKGTLEKECYLKGTIAYQVETTGESCATLDASVIEPEFLENCFMMGTFFAKCSTAVSGQTGNGEGGDDTLVAINPAGGTGANLPPPRDPGDVVVSNPGFSINAGGPAATENFQAWQADDGNGYSKPEGGSDNNIGVSCPGIGDSSVYFTNHSSGNGFSYRFPVENGSYTVQLYFIEINNDVIRQFNVNVEGVQRLDHYDIAVEAEGVCLAHKEKIVPVEVQDGELNIDFIALLDVVGNLDPVVSAIVVTPIAL